MKKILSMMLVAAMLVSALCALAVVPASAADGMWDTFAKATDYIESNADNRLSVPGYEYTDDGLHVIPGNWSTTSIFGTVATKEMVDLKDGVYLEIRVDDFTLANDKWFMFHLWSEHTLNPGSTSDEYGYGIQVLGRPSNASETGETLLKEVEWYYKYFTADGKSAVADGTGSVAKVETAEDGTVTFVEKYVLELCVTWDGESYAVTYNGAPANEKTIAYMNETFGSNSQAYVGFSFNNSTKGGNAEFTVTKFGTSKEDASTPMGDDSKEPEDYAVTYADIMDPETVPAGQPAIFMNGSADSDLAGLPATNLGSDISLNGDYIHVIGKASPADIGVWKVKPSVSYDVADFPVMMCLVKGLCTCGGDECYAYEKADFFPLIGDVLAPAAAYQIKQVDITFNPYVVEEGEHAGNYLYFFADLSDPFTATWGPSGRINGVRMDVYGLDVETAGKSTFDICWVACFRDLDEAEAYVNDYMTELGWVDPDAEDDTDAPVVTTEDPDVVTTEDPDVVTTEDPDVVTTEKPDEVTTEEQGGGDQTGGGCGSVVGFGAIALVAVAGACGVVAFRKKED